MNQALENSETIAAVKEEEVIGLPVHLLIVLPVRCWSVMHIGRALSASTREARPNTGPGFLTESNPMHLT